MTRAVRLVLPLAAALLATPAHAQFLSRLSLAAGPSVVISDAPPDLGGHVRLGLRVADLTPRLSLDADLFFTRLFPATTRRGAGLQETSEHQEGAGLALTYTFTPERTASPFVRLGATAYRYDVRDQFIPDAGAGLAGRVEERDDLAADVLVAAGLSVRTGTRRVLLEARVYGGTAIHVPVTLGVTF